MTAQLSQEHLTKISSEAKIFQIKLKGIEAFHPFSKLDALSAKQHFRFSTGYNLYNIIINSSGYAVPFLAFIYLQFSLK